MSKHSMVNHKAVCFTLWFPVHNNPRYAALFPKLSHIVRFHKVTLSRQRIIRGIQYRLWHRLKEILIYPIVVRHLAHRYPLLFTVDIYQIPYWPRANSVVVDADDPLYTKSEVYLLNLPQVKAIVVTTQKSKEIFQQLGITKPIYVIPQGVTLNINNDKVQEIRAKFKQEGEIVVGYHAPTLTLSCDGPRRPRQGMDDLDFLFDSVEKAREEDRQIVVWLFGEPSKGVKRYADGKPWIKLFGYVPFSDILNYVANFDIGAYPRRLSDFPGRFRVKIAEYMALGIPVVSTRTDEAFILQDANCGVVCSSVEDFSKALVELARSADMRVQLGSRGRAYAKAHLDWDILVQQYEEILRIE